MNVLYKTPYYIVLAVVFLLPVFFIPSALMPLGIAKSTLIAVAALVGAILFLVETFRRGQISYPGTWLLFAIPAFPLVYLLASLGSVTRSLSLFGYSFEMGTFAYTLFAAILMGLTAIVVNDRTRILKVYTALLASFVLVIIFAVIKIVSGGDILTWNTFFGNMGNPIGAWTDYAIGFALIALLSMFGISMLDFKGPVRWFLIGAAVLSTILLAIINFSTAWMLVLIFSLVLIVYEFTVENRLDKRQETDLRSFPRLATGLFLISLLFVLNPVISSTSGTLSNYVSGLFGVTNTEVRPSLSATFDISKPVLRENALLGSGPNTFARDWSLYKPSEVNTSTFWNTVFPSGVSYVSSQVAATGALGSLLWILFLGTLAFLGGRAVLKNPESKSDRFLLISSLLGTLFLWVSALFYVPSIVILTLAFIFTGIFVGALGITGVVPTKTLIFARSLATNFAAVLVMVVLLSVSIVTAFVGYQRIASTVFFQKAIVLSNTEGSSIDQIESSLAQALTLSGHDIYYRTLSELQFARAEAAAISEVGTTEARTQEFQTRLSQSISAAQAAVSANPASYTNWAYLGLLYASLVPAPLNVEGSYESARAAYEEAAKRNPTSPEIPLLIAKLELLRNNEGGAREHIARAIALKQDYADAYFLLSQIEISKNNVAAAISSAETGALLSPGNAGVQFELGLLKYSNKDYNGAGESFVRALQIAPDYANAKYFLGLTLASLDRNEDAITVFEDLLKTNPDSQEVKTIIENLRAGRAATFGFGERATQ